MLNWIQRRGATIATVGLLAMLVPSLHRTLKSQTQSVSPRPVDYADRNGDIQIVSTVLASGTQQLVVTDTTTRVMAVYHVDPVHGKLQLLSVRSLVWDLRMEEFNGQAPLPSELRAVQP